MALKWPWRRGRIERRQSNVAGDPYIAQLLAGAPVHGLAAVEACAGMIARAGACSTVSGEWAHLFTAPVKLAVYRDLATTGESLWEIEVAGGEARIHRASAWDVYGGRDENEWLYSADFSGPSRLTRRSFLAPASLHFRYSTDAFRPHVGISPLERSGLTRDVLDAVTRAISTEARTPAGMMLRIPAQEGGSDAVSVVAEQVRSNIGRSLLVVENTSQHLAESRQYDWSTQRIGSQIPESLTKAASEAVRAIFAAYGIGIELYTTADGTGQRESWRRFTYSTMAAFGRVVADEIQRKLGPAEISWESLRASDIAGRGRAFASVTDEKLSLNEARAFAWIDEP